MSLEVLLSIAGLALLDTLSPATIGITVYLLLSVRDRLGLLLFTYLGTVAVLYFALGTALKWGLDAALAALGAALENQIAFWIQLAIGVVLFVGAWFVPRKKGPATPDRRPRVHTVPAVIAAGTATVALEAAMALPYVGAIGIMSTAGLPARQWVPLLAAYNIIMVLVPILMYSAWRVLGTRMQPRLQRWRDTLARHSREAFSWIMGIAGFLILRDAVFRLAVAADLLPF